MTGAQNSVNMHVRNVAARRPRSWQPSWHATRNMPRSQPGSPVPRPACLPASHSVQLSWDRLSTSMVVLRCTQRLLFRLKQFDDEPSVRSTTRLGDWYGNVLHMGRRHALIFISEQSRLPVFIPIREANRLAAAFPDAVCQMLGAVGVPADEVELERLRMSEIAYARTKNRSLLGTLNDMSFGARVHFITARHDSLEDIALRLAETPIMPLNGANPIDLTLDVFVNR